MTSDPRHSRRDVLYSLGAGAVTLASLSPTTAPGLSGWEAPTDAVAHSDGRFSWLIPVNGSDASERAANLDALEDELSSYDNTQTLSERRHDGAGTLTAVAPPKVIGARNRDRWLANSGIANSLAYIDTSGIEINRTVTLANPLTPDAESAWTDPGVLESAMLTALSGGIPQPGGVAFDADMSEDPMQAAREAVAATDAETTLPDTADVTVAVADTGVNNDAYLDDADGNSRLRTDSKNFAAADDPTGREAVRDGDGHGSWCSACLAANPPTDDTLEGFLPAADVLGVKVLGDDGSGQLDNIAAGIRYVADTAGSGTVLNLSLGSPQYSTAINNALEYAVEQGVIPVVAAGNDRQATRWVATPASSEHTIAVGATTVAPPAEAQSAYYSNIGPHNGYTDGSGGVTQGAEIDVAAPGCKLEAASGDVLTGTSMAGPVTAGVVGLYLADGGEADLETVRERLRQTAAPVPKASAAEVGHGMPSAANLLSGTEPDESQADAEIDQANARGSAYRTLSGNPVFTFQERAANFL